VTIVVVDVKVICRVMADQLAQTALTVFAVLCGLAAVLFVQPPTRLDQHGQRRNWRPTLLVLGLFA